MTEFAFPTKHEVIAAIRAAFDGVERGDGVTLHEADAMDMHAPAEEQAAARLLDTDQIWEQVPVEDVRRCGSALSFMDAAAFRYYLPAYMCWALDERAGGDWSSHTTVHHLCRLHKRRLRVLDDAQRGAIALFLLYLTPSCLFGDEAREALHRFWGQYLPERLRQEAMG